MPWWIILIVGLAAAGFYLLRDKIKELLGGKPKEPSFVDTFLDRPPMVSLPEPPVVDAPIVREDDAPVWPVPYPSAPVGGEHDG